MFRPFVLFTGLTGRPGWTGSSVEVRNGQGISTGSVPKETLFFSPGDKGQTVWFLPVVSEDTSRLQDGVDVRRATSTLQNLVDSSVSALRPGPTTFAQLRSCVLSSSTDPPQPQQLWQVGWPRRRQTAMVVGFSASRLPRLGLGSAFTQPPALLRVLARIRTLCLGGLALISNKVESWFNTGRSNSLCRLEMGSGEYYVMADRWDRGSGLSGSSCGEPRMELTRYVVIAIEDKKPCRTEAEHCGCNVHPRRRTGRPETRLGR
jgi:hypothetical protein